MTVEISYNHSNHEYVDEATKTEDFESFEELGRWLDQFEKYNNGDGWNTITNIKVL